MELAEIQRRVATQLDAPIGRLLMTVKSAHIYQTEMDYMRAILATWRER